jgi:hypothetical protein
MDLYGEDVQVWNGVGNRVGGWRVFYAAACPGAAGGDMWRVFWLRLSELAAIAMLMTISTWARQERAGTAAGAVVPVPPQIFSAKKIFVSNGGADSGLFPHPFSGTPERAYGAFYAAMQGWGRYEMVSSPRDAELVAELQLISPSGPANANKQKGASDPLPFFRLTIFDRETHYALWTFTETIEQANLQKTHDRNFDDALATLTADLKKLASTAAATAPAQNSTSQSSTSLH